jgi:hypothetical protein
VTDLSGLSNDELMALYHQGSPSGGAPSPGAADLSKMSNDDLMALYHQKSDSSLSAAITDIPAEIGRTAAANWQTIKEPFTNPHQPTGMFDFGRGAQVGRQLAAIPALAASPITGAARSLIGHTYTAAENTLDRWLNPDKSPLDLQTEYEKNAAAGEQSLMALGPKGGMPKIPKVAPVTAADLAPFEMHPDAPVAELRPESGARLLPPDVPHTLPDNTPTTVPKQPGLPGRAGVGAEGAQGPLAEVSQGTLEHLRNVLLNEDSFTPYALDQRLDEMSPHQFLGELSPNLEARMGGVAAFPGASRTEIVNAVTQRGAEAKERIGALLDDAFGEPQDLSQMRRQLTVEQQRLAGPLYRAFKELNIPPTQEMLDLVPRLRAAGAFGAARRLAGIRGVPFEDTFSMDEGLVNAPTAQSWDLVKQALDAKIEGSFNTFGEPTKWTAAYTQLKNELTSAIDNHPDEAIAGMWKLARDTFAGPAQIKAAQQMGKRILTERIDANELPFMTASYSQAQMRGLTDGIRAQFENMMGRAGPQERRTINQILSPNNQQKIRWVIGDDAAERLFAGVEHESAMWDAPTRIIRGSPTAAREAAKVDYGPQAGVMSPENIANFLSGAAHPVQTAGKAAFKVAGQRFNNAREAAAAKFREETARLMTLQGPERDAVLRWLVEPPPSATP